MKYQKINWKKIWRKFNKWHSNVDFNSDSWQKQKNKIQNLIEEELLKKELK